MTPNSGPQPVPGPRPRLGTGPRPGSGSPPAPPRHARPLPLPLPLPLPDPASAAFWEACRAHVLVAQRCDECRAWRWTPQGYCPNCHAKGGTWEELAGTGEVVSFVVCHVAGRAGSAGEVPFTVADVRLDGTDGAVVLTSNVVGCRWETVRVGMPVEVVFDDVTDDTTLPRFRPGRGAR